MPYADPEQQRAYQREWIRRRREEWLEGKCCAECGARSGLEVHHRDPAQKITHRVWSWARERREAELAKCVVLCIDCHEDAHAEDAHSYRRGCRCDECRARHRNRARSYRARVAA